MDLVTLVSVIAVIASILCAVIGFFIGVTYRRKVAEAQMGSAEEEAKRIVSDALKTADVKKKEAS